MHGMPNTTSPEFKAVEKALHVAKIAHSGQKRSSGEPYITHLIAVRDLLKEVNADQETLIAALLHDTIEDTSLTYEDIKRDFGETVAKLVEGVTKVQKLEGQMDKRERNMQSIRKIFRTMGKDIRVIFIKLADRLHNMRTLEFVPEDKQQRIARETLDIYCPVADLLGIDIWYRELSDLCLHILNRPAFDLITRKAESVWNAQHSTMEKWIAEIQKGMHGSGWKNVKMDIICRNMDEIFVRTQGHESDLQNIESFCTVRVIIPNDADCYACMGALHKLVAPVPGEMQDYIAAPKLNGYSALHSGIMSPSGKTISFVFQTHTMSEQSTYGSLMTYRHHDSFSSEKAMPEWVSALIWLEQDEQDSRAFFDILHSEIFGERIRVYLSKGKQKFIEVPAESTVLDTAYYISEDTGTRITSCLINHQESALKSVLSDGDTVEFKVDPRGNQRTASDLGFLRTSLARKLLISHLISLPAREQELEGANLLRHAVDISMDPFFGIAWQKQIRSRITAEAKELANIGTGITNPFLYIEDHSSPEEFLLLDPKCFIMVSRLSPSAGMHFVLRTELDELRSGNIIGLQSGPDVIDIISADILMKERRFSKEYVPIRTRPALLEFPFFFALRFDYLEHANPLTGISTLQNMLDTPVNLLQFENGSVTLGFHTDTLRTVQIAYEYLSALPYVSDIFRITPP